MGRSPTGTRIEGLKDDSLEENPPGSIFYRCASLQCNISRPLLLHEVPIPSVLVGVRVMHACTHAMTYEVKSIYAKKVNCFSENFRLVLHQIGEIGRFTTVAESNQISG